MSEPHQERVFPARPTMKAIAEQVGVSIKSVSRVLNEEGGVSADTADRVLAAADRLGFRRNHLARSLRQGGRTETIGLVVKHSSTRFYDNLIRGVEGVTARHGLFLLTAASQSADREKSTLLALSSRQVDGLLVVPTGSDQSYLRPEQFAGTPMVFIDRPPTGLEADTVVTDNVGGGEAAARHLLDRGHRRIAVLGAASSLYTVRERLRGVQSALRRAKVRADRQLTQLDLDSVEDVRGSTLALLALPDPPSAIFSLNNVCTIGVVRALREVGLSDRIAVIGFDDFELADLLQPAVTVVAHDIGAMGRLAAERLLSRMAGDTSDPQTVTLPTHLISRGSGEIPPGIG